LKKLPAFPRILKTPEPARSAKIAGKDGKEVFRDFRAFLDHSLEPAAMVKDIMSTNIVTVADNATLMEASIFMEKENRTSAPVVDAEGFVCGFISLRDIMKGRKNGRMQSPIKAYMSRPVISAAADDTVRDVERLFYRHKIGCLPILESGRLIGMVTRWDYLQFQRKIF
jgi:tRNA nucleotidyltransferase (CCA-adding enzyme)